MARRKTDNKSTVSILVTDTKSTDELLAKLPIELREKAVVKAIRRASNKVAKQARKNLRKISTPGYEGDKESKVPLERTIRTKVKAYKRWVIGFVGAEYPAGAHSHLLEFGFMQKTVLLPGTGGVKVKRKVAKKVPPKPWLRPAADTTKAEQEKAIIDTLKAEIEKIA